jgi:hypothetical protein
MRYYAVRPITDDVKHRTNYTRVEKAETPTRAYDLAFGRGGGGRGFEWKDLGTRVSVLHVDRTRVALLTGADGWNRFTKGGK